MQSLQAVKQEPSFHASGILLPYFYSFLRRGIEPNICFMWSFNIANVILQFVCIVGMEDFKIDQFVILKMNMFLGQSELS